MDTSREPWWLTEDDYTSRQQGRGHTKQIFIIRPKTSLRKCSYTVGATRL